MEKAQLKPEDVKAIGLSGQMHGSVFLDKKNQVVRRAILWNDQRTAAECDEIEQRAGGRKKLIKMVANPGHDRLHRPEDPLAAEQRAEELRQDRPKVLLPKDEIRRRLTGEFATEVSDASGMLLLDVAKRKWSKKLLEGAGSRHRSVRHGLRIGGGDRQAHCRGGGNARADDRLPGRRWGRRLCGGRRRQRYRQQGRPVDVDRHLRRVMFVHSDDVKIDPKGRVHTFCHAVRGKWHMMGVNLSASGSLQWFRNELCKADVEVAETTGQEIYDILTDEASKAPAGSDGLFFLPYLSGERTPHADPDARGCFVGLTLAHTRGHMLRSIMEGVTYSMRDSLAIIEDLGVPVKQIRASGGGSRSPFWRQIQADVFGRKVVTINTEEGPAYGVALLAAVGAGEFKNIQEACTATIRVEKETTTDRQAKKRYDKAFPIYQQLYESLKADFKAIAKLS